MIITALVENTTKSELKTKHGLSLFIRTKKHKILFDLGSDNTLFDNAEKRGIDLSEVDTVIISHGHFDHGGALSKLLSINSMAKIYIQREAFEPHYSKTFFLKVPVGLDKNLETNPQIVMIDGDYIIDDELSLFTVNSISKCYSPANNALYDKNGKDSFSHEQNLIISENQVAVIMGCGHTGVVNIMEKAKRYEPKFCIGGFHLFNPLTRMTVPVTLLDQIAGELQAYGQTQFYTCHCTGVKAYRHLSKQLKNLHFMACGDSIEI